MLDALPAYRYLLPTYDVLVANLAKVVAHAKAILPQAPAVPLAGVTPLGPVANPMKVRVRAAECMGVPVISGSPYRATDATVYCVVEGQGRTRIGDRSLSWGPRDIFVVPSWYRVSHEANQEAVLFSFSDRPAQKALGLWREQAPLCA